MTITNQDILNANFNTIEIGIPKSEYWFEDGSSFRKSDFIIVSFVKEGKTIEFNYEVSVSAYADFVTHKGDGYYTPDFTDMKDFGCEIEISNPYSEDADIDFDIFNNEVNAVLTKVVEKALTI